MARVSARVAAAGPRFDLLEYPMFYVAHVLRRYDANVVQDLQAPNLSQSDWRILSTLHYVNDLTLTELARYTALERSFVGRMVADLEARRLVVRLVPDNDRRTTRVQLTAAGQRCFADLLCPAVEANLARAFAGIAPADRRYFLRLLQKMMRNVYHHAGEAAPGLE